jgi:hypothetical protein
MLNKMPEGMPAKMNSDISDRILQDIPDKIQNICQIEYQKIYQITKGSVSYLSSPCFSTIIGGIGGLVRAKRRIAGVMYFRFEI